MNNNNRKQYGFTLIELLIAMAVFSILMAAVYNVYISSNRSITIQNVSAGAQQSVRAGIEIMVQDVRMAGYDPLKNSGASIEIAQAGKIRITSDRNEDNVINDADFERISYELSGGQLNRILYEGTDSETILPMIDNVTDLVFTYSGSNNAVVGIALEITEPAGMSAPVFRRLETQVYCRNLAI